MTSNHHGPRRRRTDGALLAGVCSGIAQRLGWNAWALRALFVIGLFVETIGTGVVYLVLAFLVPRCLGNGRAGHREGELESPELQSRKERIADLERRFRDLEQGER